MDKKLYVCATFMSFCSLYGYAQNRPNIILIMADDMGYSDIGCYGGEILTPNIDGLAEKGIRLTQFYNTSRSCPTRACLMTGLFQHRAGIGWMSEDPFSKGTKDSHDFEIEGYRGFLNRNCVTIAEVLKSAGYHTYMAGKWHLGMHGEDKWPLQRGFDRFYGILSGACSYLRPDGGRGLTLDNTHLPAPEAPYYTTDAFADYAIRFVEEQKDDKPFFLYLAFNAPHWPLQAKTEDIEKFYDKYRSEGWDNIRKDRLEKMIDSGILPEDTGFAEWENRSWNELSEKEKDMTAYRMAVYAAQVHCMDYNIGRVLSSLESSGKLENTLVIFLSDNGACSEPDKELGGGRQEDINNPMISGFPSYGRAWAQTSNTPFRKYKQRAYEGGISTPFIVYWKGHWTDKAGSLINIPAYLPDIMPTVIEVSGAEYPEFAHGGNKIYPLAGKSMIPVLDGKVKSLHKFMYWEHQGSRAIRWKNWKAVWDRDINQWELYDIGSDRTEKVNMASEKPAIVKKLSAEWNKWADENGVLKDFNNRK